MQEVVGVLGLAPEPARRRLAYLAERGWLARVRRGLYVTVPLGAASPGEWRADPWHVAINVYAPGYIGGWSACEHWGMTEQLFRDVVVVTARKVRSRHQAVQGTRFRVKRLPVAKHFGLASVWRGDVRVLVSDPARTLVDVLDEPALGGGMRHVAEIVAAWFERADRDDEQLLEYIARLGNRSVYKRLGYLVEALGLDVPNIVSACCVRRSTGLSRLDPDVGAPGRIDKRWNLRVNVRIARRER